MNIDILWRAWRICRKRRQGRGAYNLGQAIVKALNAGVTPPRWTEAEAEEFTTWACKNIALKDPPR